MIKKTVSVRKPNGMTVYLDVEVTDDDVRDYGRLATAKAVHRKLFPGDTLNRYEGRLWEELNTIADAITVERFYEGPRIKGVNVVRRQ